MWGLLRVVGERAWRYVRSDLVAVLARNVAAHRVVAREGARAMRARHADALVPLPDVRAQVRLVPVQPLAVRALQLLTWNNHATNIK